MCFQPSYFVTSLKFFFDKTEIDHWQWPVIESSEGAGSLCGWQVAICSSAGFWPTQHGLAVKQGNPRETMATLSLLVLYSSNPQCASPQLRTSMLRSEARKTRLFNMLVLTPVPAYFIPFITYFKTSSFLQVQWRQGKWYFLKDFAFLACYKVLSQYNFLRTYLDVYHFQNSKRAKYPWKF